MTFAVNYVGEPFNTPLSENRLFYSSVRWSAALYIALVIDIPRGARGHMLRPGLISRLRAWVGCK